MKLLTVSVLICSMMALAGAAALQEAEKENETAITQEERRVDKRSTYCPNGWTKYDSRCFFYISHPMPWAQAEKNCLSMGANLASVSSMNDYHAVQTIILEHAYRYEDTWIGGSDCHEEGSWFWSDGSPFYFQHWCSGEPNNLHYQHCLITTFRGNACWDDLQCNSALPSVCAKKI